MKQLHNIVAPLILFCLMAAVSLPVLAQEQEHPEQDHPHRCHLPGCGGCAADHSGQPDRYEHPAGRYQPADRGWCGT